MKLNRRKLQEKAADKAKQRKKRRQRQISRMTSGQPSNSIKNHQPPERSRNLGLDKELLAMAKVQFAGPPSNTDHPISGLSVPKPINFTKGETINPYRPEKGIQGNSTSLHPYVNHHHPPQQQQKPSTQTMCSSDSQFDLDPLRPPIVRLTEQSTEGDGRFLKDPEHLLRIFKEVHQEYGLDPSAAVTDLESYRKYLSSERIHRLQQLRESGS